MYLPDPNWPRWIKASIATFFQEAATLNSLKMYLEGADRDTNKSEDYFELRINGPSINQLLSYEFQISLTINVLIASIKDDNDAYKIERNVGIIQTFFVPSIPIKRYGAGIQDDQTIVDYVVQCYGKKGNVVLQNLGQFNTDIRLMQSVLEAEYEALFTVDSGIISACH